MNDASIPSALQESLQQESLKRAKQFLRGLNRYSRSLAAGPSPSPCRSHATPQGTLHFYFSDDAKAKRRPLIFCIPSLINRHYILDLTPQNSLVRRLNGMGFDAVILEWPEPTDADADKNMAAYVLDVLTLLQAEWEQINRPILALGYCIGGIVATALARLFERVQGLMLLATPWDYQHYPLAKMAENPHSQWHRQISEDPLFSAEAIQTLLYLANGERLFKRFSRFTDATAQEEMERFVALEHWAQDCLPLTRALALESLVEWPKQNLLAKGQWQVQGEVIDPAQITVPALAALPKKDVIVPDAVARPLADALPDCRILQPCGGHVGMVAGSCRKELESALNEFLAHFR